jgi:hypothetical protein
LKVATAEAATAGLLHDPRPDQRQQPIYQLIYNDDPTLSLAGLRIAIEKRLRDLATKVKLENAKAPLKRLVDALSQAGVLTRAETGAFHDLSPLLNAATCSLEYSKEGADWAFSIGPQLLASSEEKAISIGGFTERLWGNSSVHGVGTVILS